MIDFNDTVAYTWKGDHNKDEDGNQQQTVYRAQRVGDYFIAVTREREFEDAYSDRAPYEGKRILELELKDENGEQVGPRVEIQPAELKFRFYRDDPDANADIKPAELSWWSGRASVDAALAGALVVKAAAKLAQEYDEADRPWLLNRHLELVEEAKVYRAKADQERREWDAIREVYRTEFLGKYARVTVKRRETPLVGLFVEEEIIRNRHGRKPEAYKAFVVKTSYGAEIPVSLYDVVKFETKDGANGRYRDNTAEVTRKQED